MFYTFLLFLNVVFCIDDYKGWSYINLHCRDNDNEPVDWWYIYKPPRNSDDGPFVQTGRNFAFISSATKGKWQKSDKQIIENSMLQYTLSPLYRPTYVEHFASLIYTGGSNHGKAKVSSNGVLMADLNGAVWLGHSVPGLIDLEDDRTTFPANEFDKGHLMFCISMGVDTANLFGSLLKQISPQITHLSIPLVMKKRLLKWQSFSQISNDKSPPYHAVFSTPNTRLKATIMVRRPGDDFSPYEVLTKKFGVIMDVYGHKQQIKSYCNKQNGLRKIKRISLKFPNEVYYINSSMDAMGFSVSTAAHWQTRDASNKEQYWACTTSVDNFNDTRIGGLLLCVLDYNVWWAFDNLKVKEPKC